MKGIYRGLLALLVLGLLAACGATPAAEEAPASNEATGETSNDDGVDRSKLSKELYFYNYTDYIEPTILDDFEAEYGVKVIVNNYDANEDMIAKVRAGNSGYDIVMPTDYAVEIMWREGLLQEIDQSMLPNLTHIDPSFLNKYFDEGNKYSVPYMYGITGIAYNKSLVKGTPDSWSLLFDEATLEQYKGQFGMLDDEREVPGAALKYLGYSLNETSPEAMQKVQELLIAQKEFVAAYNSSDGNRKLASGEYVMAHCWNGQALQARNGLGDEFAGNPDIVFFIPKEGGTIYMDNMAILKDAPNAYTAHVFINYLLRPDIAAKNTNYLGYLTPNKDAVELLDPTLRALYAEGFAPDAEVIKRLEWLVRTESTTVFSDVWTAVKGE